MGKKNMKVNCIIALARKNRTPDGQSILFVLKLQRLFQHLEDKMQIYALVASIKSQPKKNNIKGFGRLNEKSERLEQPKSSSTTLNSYYTFH